MRESGSTKSDKKKKNRQSLPCIIRSWRNEGFEAWIRLQETWTNLSLSREYVCLAKRTYYSVVSINRKNVACRRNVRARVHDSIITTQPRNFPRVTGTYCVSQTREWCMILEDGTRSRMKRRRTETSLQRKGNVSRDEPCTSCYKIVGRWSRTW